MDFFKRRKKKTQEPTPIEQFNEATKGARGGGLTFGDSAEEWSPPVKKDNKPSVITIIFSSVIRFFRPKKTAPKTPIDQFNEGTKGDKGGGLTFGGTGSKGGDSSGGDSGISFPG